MPIDVQKPSRHTSFHQRRRSDVWYRPLDGISITIYYIYADQERRDSTAGPHNLIIAPLTKLGIHTPIYVKKKPLMPAPISVAIRLGCFD